MDRGQWIGERRAAVVAEYDPEAATYDRFPYPNEVHREWVRRLLLTCPAGGLVLDAACGTGQYFSVVAEAGLRVVGTDQSAGMLAQARARGIASKSRSRRSGRANKALADSARLPIASPSCAIRGRDTAPARR